MCDSIAISLPPVEVAISEAPSGQHSPSDFTTLFYSPFDADSDGTSLAFQFGRVPEIQPITFLKSALLLYLCPSLSLSISDRPLQRLLRCPSYSHTLIRSLSRSLCNQSDLSPTILSDFDFKV